VIATLVLALAACGGSSSPAPSAGASQAPSSQPAASASPAASPSSAGGGGTDCAAIDAAAVQLINLQLLAQLRSADSVEGVRSKTIGNLDIDDFLAAMHTLHALDGTASPLGDPKDAIAFYERAGEAAKVLLATDPVTQDAIDTYLQNVGTIAEFLGHQTSIAAAISEAGC